MAHCVPRRRFLQLGASGVAGVLAGCSASPDRDDASYPEPEYADNALVGGGGSGNSCTSISRQRVSLQPNQFTETRAGGVDGSLELGLTIRSGGPVDLLLLPPQDPDAVAKGLPIVYGDVAEFSEPITAVVVTGQICLLPDPSRVYQVVIDNSRYGETPPGDTVEGELVERYEECERPTRTGRQLFGCAR